MFLDKLLAYSEFRSKEKSKSEVSMIWNELEVDRLLQPPAFVKINGKVPAWMLADRSEGIQLEQGKIKGFTFWDNERDYHSSVRDSTLLNLINTDKEAKPKPVEPEKREEKIKEKVEEKIKETIEELKKEKVEESGKKEEATDTEITVALSPETFKVDQYKRLLSVMKTDPKNILKKIGRSGKEESYIKIGYIINCLNFVSGFKWSIAIDHIEERSSEIIADVTISMEIDGKSINKTQSGNSDIHKKKDGTVISIGDDRKAAISDAIKKAASLYGIAADVYGGEI